MGWPSHFENLLEKRCESLADDLKKLCKRMQAVSTREEVEPLQHWLDTSLSLVNETIRHLDVIRTESREPVLQTAELKLLALWDAMKEIGLNQELTATICGLEAALERARTENIHLTKNLQKLKAQPLRVQLNGARRRAQSLNDSVMNLKCENASLRREVEQHKRKESDLARQLAKAIRGQASRSEVRIAKYKDLMNARAPRNKANQSEASKSEYGALLAKIEEQRKEIVRLRSRLTQQ